MKMRKWLSVSLTLCLLLGLAGGASVSAITYQNLGLDVVNLTQECIDRSLQQMGNSTRLANVMRRAEAGEEITIAFIGGSITYGSGMIDKDGSKADRFTEHVQGWFEEHFPKATVHLVNAGLPATGSLLGVFRAPEDIWQHKPDLFVIEFAVNEGTSLASQQANESLIRTAMSMENDPAVLYLMMCKPSGTGWHDPDGKTKLANHYDLPVVSFSTGVKTAVQLGVAQLADFNADGTHPNKMGHAATGLFLINYLEKVYADYQNTPQDVPELPEPMYGEPLKHVLKLTSLNHAPSSTGSFQIDDNASMWGQFKNGWSVHDGGTKPIVFEVEAKRVYIPYQKSTTNDGKAKVTVNGVPVDILSSRADYNQVGTALVFDSETTKKVTVEIEVVQGTHFVLSGLWISY